MENYGLPESLIDVSHMLQQEVASWDFALIRGVDPNTSNRPVDRYAFAAVPVVPEWMLVWLVTGA